MSFSSVMELKHDNPMVAEFMVRPSRSTLMQFTKADLVDLAEHLGWSSFEDTPKKAKMREIVEGLAVSAKLLEAAEPQTVGFVSPQFHTSNLSFEQCMELEKERAKIEREKWQFQLEQERLKVDLEREKLHKETEIALERERFKVEQLKLELIKEGRANESLLS